MFEVYNIYFKHMFEVLSFHFGAAFWPQAAFWSRLAEEFSKVY